MDESDLNHLRDLAKKTSLKRLQDLLEDIPDKPQPRPGSRLALGGEQARDAGRS